MQSELWCTQTLRNVRTGTEERLVRSTGSRRCLDGTAVLDGESVLVSGYPGSSPGEKDLQGTGEEEGHQVGPQESACGRPEKQRAWLLSQGHEE